MSLFFGRSRGEPPAAVRSELHPWGFPYEGGDDFNGGFAAPDTKSFTGAMASVAVRSTADLIASTISELPVHTYRRPDTVDGTAVQAPNPPWLDDPAGDGHGREDWLYQLILSWLMRGNAYGDILDRSPLNFPTQVLLYHPDCVSVQEYGGGVRWMINGREVTKPGDFMHKRVNPVPGELLGLSPLAVHAASLGVSLASTRFGLQWFTDGAHPTGILTNELVDDLNRTSIRKAKMAFINAMRGTREPVVLGRGWKYDALQVTPEESQFLATQGWSEAQCARIFGPGYAEIFGYESGGQNTYANVESRSALLLVYGLGKWISRADRVLSWMTPKSQYIRLDRDALLRTTTLDRFRAHELALKNRWKVVNEVRKDEDLEPVEWGDEPNPVAGAAPEGGDKQDQNDGNDNQGAQS